MDMCSLEEDEHSDMFITQESRNVVPLFPNFDVESDMEVGQGNVVEIGNASQNQYLDISDAEDFEVPSSQQEARVRWVLKLCDNNVEMLFVMV